MEFILADESETRKFGAELGKLLLPGDVVALYGNLGAGKTTLVRGLVQYFCGAATEVPSPTYTLVQSYEADSFVIWHFDLYRIESPSELDELGWDNTEDAVLFVEWPERAGDRLPIERLNVTLSNFVKPGRMATITSQDKLWKERIMNQNFTNGMSLL